MLLLLSHHIVWSGIVLFSIYFDRMSGARILIKFRANEISLSSAPVGKSLANIPSHPTWRLLTPFRHSGTYFLQYEGLSQPEPPKLVHNDGYFTYAASRLVLTELTSTVVLRTRFVNFTLEDVDPLIPRFFIRSALIAFPGEPRFGFNFILRECLAWRGWPICPPRLK